ncbi:MAG: arsenite methyltransferase [Chloroflexota bacterium]
MADIRDHVRARYGAIARQKGARSCGCGSSDCCSAGSRKGGSVPNSRYSSAEMRDLPEAIASPSLGCGNPHALAALEPGQIVLDLGSGGGLDVLIAARRVAPGGKAYGLDMTPEMIDLARRNQRQAGVDNAEFILGDIEAIPLGNDSVDVIISNCVINLAPDKDAVLREAYRVLRPSGRLAVSDTVFRGDVPVPDALRAQADAWAACISGSLSERDYLTKLRNAGFTDCVVSVTQDYGAVGMDCCGDWPAGLSLASAQISARKPLT